MSAASALPKDITILVPRARDTVLRVEFRDGQNQPIDLTGDTLRCQVFQARGGAKAIDPDPTIAADAPTTAGNATLTFTAAQTEDGLDGDTYSRWYYVIDRTHAGLTSAWFEGAFRICPVASE